jgi:hypothetical protein
MQLKFHNCWFDFVVHCCRPKYQSVLLLDIFDVLGHQLLQGRAAGELRRSRRREGDVAEEMR